VESGESEASIGLPSFLPVDVVQQLDVILQVFDVAIHLANEGFEFGGVEGHCAAGNASSDFEHYLAAAVQFNCEVVDPLGDGL
jgi:hypothetical protein